MSGRTYSPYPANLSCMSGSYEKRSNSGAAARIRLEMSLARPGSLALIASIIARKITSVSFRMSSVPLFSTRAPFGEVGSSSNTVDSLLRDARARGEQDGGGE